MAATHTPSSTPQTKVFCADCRHFVRDTDGISHNIETGEYFMGICKLGLTPDTSFKQFANKPRICRNFSFQK